MSILMTEYDYATDMAVLREESYEDGLFAGLEQGAYQNKLETARALLAEGLDPKMVARCTNLPLDVVQGLMQAQ